MPIPNVTEAELLSWVKSALPTNWFSEEAKAQGGGLYATIKAAAKEDKFVYDKLLSVQDSLTFTDAEGDQIDALSLDYFGSKLPRLTGESDASYKARCLARLFLPVGTREGMQAGIKGALNTDPIIVEGRDLTNPGGWASWNPSSPLTAQVYGHFEWDGGNLYCDLGPYQALITVYQPEPSSDQFLTYGQIMQLIEGIKPEATVMWVKIVGPPSNGGLPIYSI